MSWNVRFGGRPSYDAGLQPDLATERAIVQVVQGLGVTTATLVDVYKWPEVYGGDAGIAEHLGFKTARFVGLQDNRVDSGLGVLLATDLPVAQSQELDLGTRAALGTVLNVGSDGLQVASVYLDDMSEAARVAQIRALLAALESNVPTVITGDLNGLRPSLQGAALRHKLGDLLVRAGVLATAWSNHPIIQSIRGMNEREVIELLLASGYTDGDYLRRPTVPAKMPCFGVDYALSNAAASVVDFDVVGGPTVLRASDHRPIVFSVTGV